MKNYSKFQIICLISTLLMLFFAIASCEKDKSAKVEKTFKGYNLTGSGLGIGASAYIKVDTITNIQIDSTGYIFNQLW